MIASMTTEPGLASESSRRGRSLAPAQVKSGGRMNKVFAGYYISFLVS
jgi:hypothetical protein